MLQHLLVILLMVSLYVPPVSGGMSYCDKANEAARMEDRRMAYPTEDGKQFQIMLNNGECELATETCVLRESYGPCGGITQFMDFHNDGTCDYVIHWKAIVDPKYGVFFGIERLGKCPLSI